MITLDQIEQEAEKFCRAVKYSVEHLEDINDGTMALLNSQMDALDELAGQFDDQEGWGEAAKKGWNIINEARDEFHTAFPKEKETFERRMEKEERGSKNFFSDLQRDLLQGMRNDRYNDEAGNISPRRLEKYGEDKKFGPPPGLKR